MKFSECRIYRLRRGPVEVLAGFTRGAVCLTYSVAGKYRGSREVGPVSGARRFDALVRAGFSWSVVE